MLNKKKLHLWCWLTYSPRPRSIVGVSPGQVKQSTMILVFVASPLRTQHG